MKLAVKNCRQGLGTMKDPTIHSSTCIQISASARDITFNLPQTSTLLSSATAISIYISSILQPLTAYTYTENCDGHPDGDGLDSVTLFATYGILQSKFVHNS
ncbi:hypothetical protein PV325_001843 [Microctonus aethiopoides]|nr:hypothetical protein PV325_001843 [Microctonus aethiopoides]